MLEQDRTAANSYKKLFIKMKARNFKARTVGETKYFLHIGSPKVCLVVDKKNTYMGTKHDFLIGCMYDFYSDIDMSEQLLASQWTLVKENEVLSKGFSLFGKKV